MKEKICNTCNCKKSIDNFYKRNDSSDGYRNDCKQCVRKRTLEYEKTHKEQNKEYKKEWQKEDVYKSYQKKYRKLNSDKISIQMKEWYKNNKESITIKRRISKTIKKENDPIFKFKLDISKLILAGIKSNGYIKKNRTEEILGCTIKEFKIYIESKFENWMNWDNKGNWNGIPTEINTSWDIDHIIPISLAKTEEETIKLNHYTNLQPLCSYTNRFIKRNKIL